MAEVWETKRSGAIENGVTKSGTIVYGGDGFDTAAAMEAAVLADADTEYNGVPLASFVTEPDEERAGKWETTLTYGTPTSGAAEDENASSFDTTGATERVLRNLSTVASGAPNGTTPPDNKGMVGVTRTGVEGIDIVVPTFEFTITRLVPDSEITGAYKNTLADLTGQVNASEFWDFAAGEVLFMGATGTQRGRGSAPWDVTFRFARRPNREDVKIAEGTDYEIELGDVEGWHHIEVRTQEVADGDAQAMVHVPAAAYVHQMYSYADFASLEID